ncbi:MAG: UDP-N-acetylmuramate dehydrogenase [Desulfobacteraceae bacterium]|nr:UDP-N-acetylmuramate dehydrogenase [Desulfobacteraceae bacterium]MBC2719329.1 UDP-N-acetylmuramate dehydrogenase [Desulfobacteraceae bacterium]
MLDFDSKIWLESRFKNSVRFDESMSKHTSLRVGGAADAFVMPEKPEDLVDIIRWCRQKDIPCLVIGDGTNLLVKDCGIRGIVIVLTKCLKSITRSMGRDGIIVTALAGARMQALCSFAIKNGLKGMNFAIGIPGTVGGGVMMNAGTAHGSIKGVLDSIKILLPAGHSKIIMRKNLNFDYRRLSLKDEVKEVNQGLPIILGACFCLHPSDPQKLKKNAEEILKARKKRQPVGLPNAGCFFKNPLLGKTAGELIELAGLKGRSIGGAKISLKHANFIINRGRASSADILDIIELVQKTVSKKFNINLEPEVKIVGQ